MYLAMRYRFNYDVSVLVSLSVSFCVSSYSLCYFSGLSLCPIVFLSYCFCSSLSVFVFNMCLCLSVCLSFSISLSQGQYLDSVSASIPSQLQKHLQEPFILIRSTSILMVLKVLRIEFTILQHQLLCLLLEFTTSDLPELCYHTTEPSAS